MQFYGLDRLRIIVLLKQEQFDGPCVLGKQGEINAGRVRRRAGRMRPAISDSVVRHRDLLLRQSFGFSHVLHAWLGDRQSAAAIVSMSRRASKWQWPPVRAVIRSSSTTRSSST